MNNHKTFIEKENGIDYYVLRFSCDNKKDDSNAKIFINKHKYSKIIILDQSRGNFESTSYFKNGQLHNIHGAAISFHDFGEQYNIYYINNNEYSEKEWLSKTRRYKLEKLKSLDISCYCVNLILASFSFINAITISI